MRKPSAVRENATRKMTTIVSNRLAGVKWIPRAGANTRKISPCKVARVAPPRTLPSTITVRLTGATRTDRKNPSLRSSITDIMVKMAVNRTIMRSAPGKK